ncbi:Cell morphogenesis protein PAG1, partial [Cladochytrium tenue]
MFTAFVAAVTAKNDEGVWRVAPFDGMQKLASVFVLALFKLGDSNAQIRKKAVELLAALESQYLPAHPHRGGARNMLFEHAAMSTSLPITYRSVQYMTACRLAAERPFMTYEMICEFCRLLMQIRRMPANSVQSEWRNRSRDFVNLMVPWVENMAEEDPLDAEYFAEGPRNCFLFSTFRSQRLEVLNIILTNLFVVSAEFGDDLIEEVESLWRHLLNGRYGHSGAAPDALERARGHLEVVLDFLIAVGVTTKNPKFVPHAKKIVLNLSHSLVKDDLFMSLIERISPMGFLPISHKQAAAAVAIPPAGRGLPLFRLSMDDFIPVVHSRPPFSISSLSCVFLVELILEYDPGYLMPLLLHLATMQMDHHMSLICEEMRLLALNLIRITFDGVAVSDNVRQILDKLSHWAGRRMWPYEDVSPEHRDIVSVNQLHDFVVDIGKVFSVVEADVIVEWQAIALSYALGCPIRHIACRSLQIYRALSPRVGPTELAEILARLSSTIGERADEQRGFALEILMTLDHVIERYIDTDTDLAPQLFWACVACLYSPNEWEFYEGASMLGKLLGKLTLDKRTENLLLVNLPTEWRGAFSGIQPLLLKGLRSARAEQLTLDIIESFLPLEANAIVDSTPHRALLSVLAFMPRLLQGLERSPASDTGMDPDKLLAKCLSYAEKLSELAQKSGQPSLARLLQSYARQRFRNKDDFLQQFTYILRDRFFPASAQPALHMFMLMFSSEVPFYRTMLLRLFKLVLPHLYEAAFAATAPRARFQDNLETFTVLDNLVDPLISRLGSLDGDGASAVLDELMARAVLLGEPSMRHITGGRSISRIVRNGWSHSAGSPGPPSAPAGSSAAASAAVIAAAAVDPDECGWTGRDADRLAAVARHNLDGVARTCAPAPPRRRNSALGFAPPPPMPLPPPDAAAGAGSRARSLRHARSDEPTGSRTALVSSHETVAAPQSRLSDADRTFLLAVLQDLDALDNALRGGGAAPAAAPSDAALADPDDGEDRRLSVESTSDDGVPQSYNFAEVPAGLRGNGSGSGDDDDDCIPAATAGTAAAAAAAGGLGARLFGRQVDLDSDDGDDSDGDDDDIVEDYRGEGIGDGVSDGDQ